MPCSAFAFIITSISNSPTSCCRIGFYDDGEVYIVPLNFGIAKGDFEVRIPRRQQNGNDTVYVHELDELKSNVNRMVSEMAGMDYMRKDFVSNVSHEIKTPAFVMMGFAEILLEDGVLLEEQKEYLSLIYGEAPRVSRLCENMLRMSRLEKCPLCPFGVTRICCNRYGLILLIIL